MSPSVAAVVVNFNSTPEIFGCIESIQEFVRPDFGVVVSNSADDLSVLARSVEKWSNWVVQFSGGNVGYGAAANIGATMVRATYLAILNPDIQMTDDAILRGVEYLERNRDTGIVGVNHLSNPKPSRLPNPRNPEFLAQIWVLQHTSQSSGQGAHIAVLDQ